MNLGAASSAGKVRPGYLLRDLLRDQFDSNLLVGKACNAQQGLQPGDELEIQLARMQILLHLEGSDSNRTSPAAILLTPPSARPSLSARIQDLPETELS